MSDSNRRRPVAILAGTALLALGGTAAVAQMRSTAPTGQPGIAASGVKPVAANQAVLDALMAANMRPYHVLTPAEARREPSFADGVKAVLRQQNRPTTPPPGVTTRDVRVRGAAGNLHGRLYSPAAARPNAPLIVYFHGGGWVVASSEVYDGGARALARETGAMVLSVDYRLAPEAKFPAQHDDALASYRWAIANARSLGADPTKIALAGESAGGNLAVATAVAARDGGVQAPVAVLAVYPIAGTDLNTASYRENAQAMPLGRAGMGWFLHHTTRTPADAADPRINLVAANLRGLPPVTIVAAQVDPLRSDGELLEQRLRQAGVRVNRRVFPRVTHEFFGADPVITEAKQAQTYAGQQLRVAFGR